MDTPNETTRQDRTLPFTRDIQLHIVAMMLYDQSLTLADAQKIEPEMFELQVHQDYARMILDHWKKYQHRPNADELLDSICRLIETSKIPLPPEIYADEEYARICLLENHDFAYVRDQLEPWLLYQGMSKAIVQSINQLMRTKNIRADIQDIVTKVTAAGQEPGGGRKAVLLHGVDVVPEDIEWLWHNRFPKGKLSILAGKPQEGKSFFTVMMAAHVTTGTPWPNEPHRPVKQGHVLVLQAEDGIADTWMRRFQWEGGDPAFLHFITGVRARRGERDQYFDLTRDLDLFEKALDEIGGVELAIVDPMMSYVRSKVDAKQEQEIRPMLQALMDVAAKKKVSLVGTTHLNKNEASDSLQRLMGSVAFGAAPRFVQLIGRQRGERDQRWFMVMKASSVPEPEQRMAHFGFRIEENRIQLTPDEQSPETADELLAPPVLDDAKDRRTKVGAARAYIEGLINQGIPTVLASEASRKVRGLAWSGWKGIREEYGITSTPAPNHDFIWHIPEKIVEQS